MKLGPIFLLPSLLVACGVASEDGVASGGDLTVTPEGPGDDITVTLIVPDEVKSQKVWQFYTEGLSTSEFLTYSFNGKTLEPGVALRTAYTPDANGFMWLKVRYKGNDHPLNSGRSLVLDERFSFAPGEKKTITLGAMQIMGFLPNRPSIDLSSYRPSESLSLRWEGADYRKWAPFDSRSNDWQWAAKGGPILPVAAGHYRWDNRLTDPFEFDVTEGRVSVVDTTIPDLYATITIKTEPAKFPTVGSSQPVVTCTLGSVHRSGAASLGAGLSVYTTEPATCSYAVHNSAGADVAESPSFVVEPRANVEVTMKRLDVDDVVLTDEGGMTVRGAYSVRNKATGATLAAGQTKTGVDLPPGEYILTIYYSSPQGTPHHIDRDISL